MEDLQADCVPTPCQLDATSECRIEQAEKVIASMNHERLEIFQKIEERKLDGDNIKSRLERLHYRAQSYDADIQKQELEPLKLALDRLSFTNNAYFDGAIKSCLLEDEVDFHNLNFRLLHGSKKMAEEKRLLRETKKSQQSGASRIQRRFRESAYYWCGEAHRRELIEEVKQLKLKREKAIANAAVKGVFWNSLGSKETIQEKIKLIEKKAEEIRQKRLAFRITIHKLEKKLEAIEKERISLQKRLTAANQKKNKAYQCILNLRKQREEIVQSVHIYN